MVTTPIPDGEDCLALNVWTPSTSGKRPVMVWLHGGGFASGSGGWGWWTGEDLAADQDVVVVTLNHRLNIFGFLCLAEHGGPAHGIATNAGMRDIVMALAVGARQHRRVSAAIPATSPFSASPAAA